jgi:hypothetical protein
MGGIDKRASKNRRLPNEQSRRAVLTLVALPFPIQTGRGTVITQFKDFGSIRELISYFL